MTATSPVAARPLTTIPAINGPAPKKRISWGAILAGVVIALAFQLLLTLLGVGIGLSTINPQSESGNPAQGLGTGAGIWWFVTGLISLYAGGWVAGRLAGIPRVTDSTLHGLLTWGLTTLVSFYLITTSVGSLISGAASMLGKGLAAAGSGVAYLAPQAGQAVNNALQNQGIDTTQIRNEAETLLRQTGKPALQPENLQAQAQNTGNQAQNQAQAAAENPQNAAADLDSLMKNLFREGQETVAAADRGAAVNVVVQRTGKPRAEAEQIVDRWIATYQSAKEKAKEVAAQAEQKAREAGEKAASGLSKMSLMAFFTLVLGAAAAAYGGRTATPPAAEEGLEA